MSKSKNNAAFVMFAAVAFVGLIGVYERQRIAGWVGLSSSEPETALVAPGETPPPAASPQTPPPVSSAAPSPAPAPSASTPTAPIVAATPTDAPPVAAPPVTAAAAQPDSAGGAGGAGGADEPGPGIAVAADPAGSARRAETLLAKARAAFEAGDEEHGLIHLLRIQREHADTPIAPTARAWATQRRERFLADAAAARQAQDLVAEHVSLGRAFLATPELTARDALRPDLDRLADRLYFSTAKGPQSVLHVVQAGDTLSGLGKRYGVPAGLIKRVNKLRSNVIRLGQRLKILKGEIGILVLKHDFRLVVTLDGRYLKQYAIGTGKDDRTPQEEFVIDTRLVEPTWYGPDGVYPYGDPKNILGTRWLGFKPTEDFAGFGIHGTTLDDSIGTASSMGCVRMHNADVEELFDLVPTGTRVTITR